MTEGEARRIDALTMAVGELNGVVKAMTVQWAQQENHASAGRTIIHEKIDALTREVGTVSANVRLVTQDVAELKNDVDENVTPAINAYNLKAAHTAGRREGIAVTGRMAYALFMALAAAVGFAIHQMTIYFGHNPVHHFPWPLP